MDYRQLRRTYPKFTYTRFSWQASDNQLRLEFGFSAPPHSFTHALTLPLPSPISHFDPQILDVLVFHLGLSLIPSYWKATCSPQIEISAAHLTPRQLKFWHKLLLKGMGEYFYKNQIDFTPADFLTLISLSAHRLPKAFGKTTPESSPQKVLVPVGGGKDSAVTLELLKPHFSVVPFLVNPVPLMLDVCRTAGLSPYAVTTTIDPLLHQLNTQGYLNGHVPVTATHSFTSILAAYLTGCGFIAFSNERSSEEGNVTYLGHTINHQYSKSLEFETDFNHYLSQLTTNNKRSTINYFSFLRSLYELQITQIFSRYPQYFNVFSSCNTNFKLDPKLHPQGLWCCKCPKCISTSLMLARFIGKDQVAQIMGAYPPDLPENQHLLDDILGKNPVKPFECVLSRAEANAALTGQGLDPLLSSWFDNPHLPGKFSSLLKSALTPSPLLDRISRLDRVLILGFAREGQSTYRFLRHRFPHLEINLADAKTPDWIPTQNISQTFFGSNYLDSLKIGNCKLVIKSPGISPHLPQIVAARSTGVTFTSATQLFFELCPSRHIIGVTGTKGKSTTVSLIHHVLSENNVSSLLVGNIGTPALDYLDQITPDTWVCMELSSYQLLDLTSSPHIAVMQNIYPDHLDYHQDFSEYKLAKYRLGQFQTSDDYFIFNADNPDSAAAAKLSPAHLLPFRMSDYDAAISSPLPGLHNRYNILPAIIISRLLHLRKPAVYKSISTFSPLATRLELVATVSDIRFYADTLATIPQATIAAISAFSSDVETLIVGGHERKQNFSELAKTILNSSIKNLIVFPTTGPRIWTEITRIHPHPEITYHYTESMSDAVKFAQDHTSRGKICLLSPASPSFTLFKDYRDEYEQYKKAIL